MNRLSLISKLDLASKSLGSNALFPAFQCFKFAGSLDVFASNGSSSVLVPLESDGNVLDITVPAHSFLDLLKGLKTEDVSLVQKGKKLFVRSGTIKGKFSAFESGGALRIPKYNKEKWDKVNLDVIAGVLSASFAASTFETGGVLRGIYINGDQVCATDKFRAVRYHLKKPVSYDAIVPPKFVNIISGVKDKVELWHVNIKKRMLYVTLDDGSVLSSLLYEGDYPSFDEIFPDTKKEGMVLLKFKDDFVESSKRHSRFLKDVRTVDKEMVVRVEKGNCTTMTSHDVLGRLKEKVSLGKGSVIRRPFRFVINPDYIKDINSSSFYYSATRGMIFLKTKSFEYVALTKREGKKND